MPVKWDEKSERDLLLVICMTEVHGSTTFSKAKWEKVGRLMKAMGHTGANWSGVSQRWSKVLVRDFLKDHQKELSDDKPTDTPTGKRDALGLRQKQRGIKRERNEEGDDSAFEEGGKRQKK
ncbi:hypothetical protein F4678DRAFT_458775 [Xylaria arbuscula]|nr:hypothetical protein F4678DRAFT_458775 [Xylaria arbuscula]